MFQDAQKLLEVLGEAGVLVVNLDRDGRVVEVNPTACEVLGFTRKEAIGQGFCESCVPADQRAEVLGAFDRARAGKASGYEAQVQRKDGSRRLVSWTTVAIKDGRGAYAGVLSTGLDVTEQRRQEEQLRIKEGTLAAAVENMVDGVVNIGVDGRIRSVNRATLEMFGYSEAELLGERVSRLAPDPIRTMHQHFVSAYVDTGQKKIIGIGRETEGQRKDGTRFPIELAVSEVTTGDEQIFTGIIRDISDRKRAEAAEAGLLDLQFHHTELERVAVAGEMAAIVAHEIRTPLNALAINLQMAERALRRDAADDRKRAKELLGTLKAEIQRINTLLEDYLKVVRRPRAKDEGEIQVNAVVREAARFMQHQAESARVRVVQDLADDLEPLRGDEAKLRQVIFNLMLNAVQAIGEDGEIQLTTRQLEGGVAITVKDNGPGIPAAKLDRIFKPFVTTKTVGTGLGLSICDRIVRRMRGSIRLESRLGEGASFEIFLPHEAGD